MGYFWIIPLKMRIFADSTNPATKSHYDFPKSLKRAWQGVRSLVVIKNIKYDITTNEIVLWRSGFATEPSGYANA